MDYMDAYRSWLERFAGDKQTYDELCAIKGDEKKIQDRFYTELSFGTAGMRGVMGAGANRMNVYNVRRASKGLALYVKKQGLEDKGVVIAYDSRKLSDVFALQTALVLAQNGVKAMLFDALRPVPVLSYAVRHLGAAAGVAITASHNPRQYNGYKVYDAQGTQLSPEVADELSALIFALSLEECTPMDKQEALDAGLLQIIGNKEVDDDYIAMVKSLALHPELLKAEGKNLKIVYTPLHGSGNVPVRRTLKELGVQVYTVPEQEAPDGDFPTVKAPNPEDPAAFQYAIPLAKQVGATVAFATDPDCDRMGVAVADKEGVFHTLTGNQIGCLLLSHIVSSLKKAGKLPKNGAVVKSIVSTELSRAICDTYGVAMFDVLTGFKFIGEKIQMFEDTGAYTFLFGFEESFGYLSGTQVRDKDGVNASLLLCEAALAARQEGVTLYDKLEALYAQYGYYTERLVSVTLPGLDGVEKMRAIMASLRAQPPKALGAFKVLAVRDYQAGTRTTDGRETALDAIRADVLYYELENGCWTCVRPSGTEPKIKFYISTRDASAKTSNALNLALEGAMKALLGV